MRSTRYIGLLLAVLMLGACHEPKGPFTDERDKEYQLFDRYVDRYGNEGMVASIRYDKETKALTSILVLSLDETTLPWGPTGERVYRADIKEGRSGFPEFGMAMLQIMKSIGIERFPAQEWCDLKNGDEPYPHSGSWRLPTIYEMMYIFGDDGEYFDMVNAAMLKAGGIALSKDTLYWTCAEDLDRIWEDEDKKDTFDPENRAVPMTCNIRSYDNKDRWLKKNRYNVRAVKYIYYIDK